MRLSSALAGLLFLVLLAVPAAGTAAQPDRYIVVLKDSASQPGAVADEHRRRFGAQPTHVYRHALKGYAATIP
ncbi:MAG: peptidase S8, partial [Actinomycetota bacterium]|nr:peptidase S8 [Actinomycetota bacterium]